jgi:hypothetical protein
MESLEGRRLMSGADDLPFVVYYPEGYSHPGISEFVPITNTGESEVRYELHARYEAGERDQLLASGTIASHTRGGVTINRAGEPGSMLVRPDVPYALVLRTSAPVAATISHYDFGTAIGESFTGASSDDWTFGEGYKDHDWTRDFIVFYNPGNDDVVVTLTAYTGNGSTIQLSKTLGGQRRGGWNLDAEDRIPAGVFGVRVQATAPIVAALSHYEIVTERGFAVLGTSGGGDTAGVVLAAEFDDLFDDHGGDDGSGGDDDGTPDQGPGDFPSSPTIYPANSYLTVLNTTDQTATVTFTFLARDDFALPIVTTTIQVAPRSRGGVTISDMGFASDDEFGVVYRSSVPVTATAAVYQGRDATGMEAATIAATQWTFGEGFMNRLRAGSDVTEDIYLFNPTGRSITVNVDFVFSTGQTVRVTKSLDPLEIEDVKAHAEEAVLTMGLDVFYGVRVTASSTIVASMEHWDRSLGGGFATLGVPGGTIVRLADVLVL